MALVFEGDNCRLYFGTYGADKKERYQIRYYDHKGKRVTKFVSKKHHKNALAYAKEVDQQLNQASRIDNATLTLGGVMKKFIAELEQRVENYRNDVKYGDKMSPATFKKTQVHLKHILFADIKSTQPSALAQMEITSITPSKVVQFQQDLKKRIAPVTVNAVVNCLGRAMSFFVMEEIIMTNPCREVRPLQEDEPQQGYTPTMEEVVKVANSFDVDQAPEDRWKYVLVKLCAETGVRISEALALQWKAIRNDVISIERAVVQGEVGKTKTAGSTRKLKISPSLASAFKQLRLQSMRTDFVFANAEGNLLSASDVLKQVLRPACKRAGVRDFGWHGLRRAWVTNQFNRGIREDHVQTLAGHAPGSKVTRAIYNKVREEDVLRDDYVVELPS